MEYVIEPNSNDIDTVYGSCIEPDCDLLGPTGYCSPDVGK